jgi:hypothetical protein
VARAPLTVMSTVSSVSAISTPPLRSQRAVARGWSEKGTKLTQQFWTNFSRTCSYIFHTLIHM